MGANVIALSAMTGSGGYNLGRQVADRLSFRYYDWEITTAAAARAGVTPNEVIAAERVPGFVERMMMRLGAVSSSGVEGGVFTEPSSTVWSTAMLSLSSEDYRQIIEKVVTELAQQGDAVIVGHAAQYTLRRNPGVLKVLLHGSLEPRAERVAAEQGIKLEEALAQVKQSDKDRTELLKRVYHFDWLDAAMYDVTLNTDRLQPEFALETIVSAAESFP